MVWRTARHRQIWNSGGVLALRAKRGRKPLGLPVPLQIFEKAFPTGFVVGTINNKKTHLRVFQGYLDTFHKGKKFEDCSLDELIDWGKNMARDGVGRQVVSNYMETVRTTLIEIGNIDMSDLICKWQHHHACVERECHTNSPSQAPICTWNKWANLGARTQHFLAVMANLGSRFGTAQGVASHSIIKSSSQGENVLCLELEDLKFQPENGTRAQEIWCSCDITEPDHAKRKAACFFHGYGAPRFPFFSRSSVLDLSKQGIRPHSIRRTLAVCFVLMIEEGYSLSVKRFYAWLRWSYKPQLKMLARYSNGFSKYSLSRLPPFKELILNNCSLE